MFKLPLYFGYPNQQFPVLTYFLYSLDWSVLDTSVKLQLQGVNSYQLVISCDRDTWRFGLFGVEGLVVSQGDITGDRF